MERIKFTTKTERYKFGKVITLFANGKTVAVVESKEEIEQEKADYLEKLEKERALAAQGKQKYTIWEMHDLFTKFLKENGIGYDADTALTGSRYVTIRGKKIRFANHERPFNSKWNFYHTEAINFPDGWFSKEELQDLFKTFIP